MNPNRLERPARVRPLLLLCAAMASLVLTPTAHAGLIISGDSVTANAGSTNNVLEIDLTNNGSSAVTIGGFSFGIDTTPQITFTSATTGTINHSYIFGSDSLFEPTISYTPIAPIPGVVLTAADVSTLVFNQPPQGTILNPGDTFGLGKVLFDVAADTGPGTIPVVLTAFPIASVSDPNFNDLSGNNGSNITLEDGAITINGQGPSPVPAPSSLLLALLACPAWMWMAWRWRIA